MGLPGSTVNRTITLTWTRGEFSAGSRTEVLRSTTNSLGTAGVVSDVPSASVSFSDVFTLGVSDPTVFTYYYWVRHYLADGTRGAAATTSASVSGSA